MDHSQRIVFNIQPQTEGFYCVWSCEGDVRVRGVACRERDGSAWKLHRPQNSGRAYVRVSSRNRDHVLRLALENEDRVESFSAEVHARLRRTSLMSALPIVERVPHSKIRRFQSWSRFAGYVTRGGRTRRVTTVAGIEVDPRSPDLPNGLYRVGDSLVLLARALGAVLEPHPTHPPELVRRTARRLLWGSSSLPDRTARPLSAQPFSAPLPAHEHERYRATGVVLDCGLGVASRIVRLLPRWAKPRGVIVYHEGHTGSGVQIGWPLISWLLRRGWEIYCVDMLLRGLNAVDASPGLSNHNDLALHEQTAAMHPIAFMLEPLRWIVDHAFSPPTDGPLLLVGRSGGGLMSYLYSAVDERISGAVAIGGGVPLSQRLETSSGDVGDYEQFAPSFYDLARHEDLMVAAAAAGLLLVFNRNDPDCFALRTDHPFGPYISKEAARFGGGLQVFVDPHHSEHDLGPDSYSVLAQFLSRYERGLVARSRVGS